MPTVNGNLELNILKILKAYVWLKDGWKDTGEPKHSGIANTFSVTAHCVVCLLGELLSSELVLDEVVPSEFLQVKFEME